VPALVDDRYSPGWVRGSGVGWIGVIPPASPITLTQRNIFIFPTPTGFAFVGLIGLLVLGGINYQSSLVYASRSCCSACSWLRSCTRFATCRACVSNWPGPAGIRGRGHRVRRARRAAGERRTGRVRGREGIQLGWPRSIMQWAELYEHEAANVRPLRRCRSARFFRPGRMLVETYYPLRSAARLDLGRSRRAGPGDPRPLFENSRDRLRSPGGGRN